MIRWQLRSFRLQREYPSQPERCWSWMTTRWFAAWRPWYLRLQGYTVVEAESAAEALRVAASAVTIHLLITDLVMPEANGLELTRRFRTVHPNTPVLMVSGSLPLLRTKSEPDLERFDFLAKPFQFDEFLHKVRKLLDVTAPLPIRKLWCAN